MSYPAVSEYYGSSARNSSGNNAYSSDRNTHTHMYNNSMTSTNNTGSQPVSYGASAYSYSNQQPTYSSIAGIDSGSDGYASSSNYGYQRGSAYDNHESSLNDSYSQNYYTRNGVGQGQQQSSSSQTEGLSNLAYASGLESANSRYNATRSTQQYGTIPQPYQQQNRVASPIETPSRYSTKPLPTSTSYPMQQQASSSSTSSQQLAANAAAALAGAVSRRYSNQQLSPNTIASRSVTNERSAAPAIARRTASPKTKPASAAQLAYSASHQQQAEYSSYNTAASQPSRRQAQPLSSGTAPRQDSGMSQGQSLQQRLTPSVQRRNIQQTGSIANLVSAADDNEQSSPEVATVQDTAPTFIDPTTVFDPYHRERERKRQDAERAVAEAKRKAEEDAKALEEKQHKAKGFAEEEARRQKQQAEAEVQKRQAAPKKAQSSKRNVQKRSGEPSVASNPTVHKTAPEPTNEDGMASELKAMMEKMKAFQSKDPSLFKKLWNDMRQPGPAPPTNPMQSPSPKLVPQAVISVSAQAQITPPTQPADGGEQQVRRPIRRNKPTQIGPDGNKLHLNGYPVTVEDNPEGLPDLGRFPAERRIRPTKYIRVPKSDSIDLTTDPEAGATIPTTSVSAPSPASKSTPSSGIRSMSATLIAASSDLPIPRDASASKSAPETVWPLEKRNALTKTALRVLRADAENAKIPLTEEDLRSMLENNPSYITLCELLEKRGLKFHRGHFARELLSSVPELKTPTPATRPAELGNPIQSVDASSVQPQATPAVATAGPQYPPGLQHYHVPPAGYAPQYAMPPNASFVPVRQPPPAPYGQSNTYQVNSGFPPHSATFKTLKPRTPSRPEPPPGSKEAAARKRDFSELVDLTDLADDDNYVAPEKHLRSDGFDPDVEMVDAPFQAYQKRSEYQVQQSQYPPPPTGWFPQSGQPILFNPHQTNGVLNKQELFADLEGQRTIMAKALDKKEALKKQYYDPKTVARDILIASGRHPSDRPLNVHLAGMLGKYIDLDSDVSTFEWDEIDPGGPPTSTVELVNVPVTRPHFRIGDRTQSRKPKQTRQSLIDKTRPPDQERREAASATSKSALSQQLSKQSQPSYIKKPSGLRHSLLASDENATPATFDPTHHSTSQFHGSTIGVSQPTMNVSTPTVRKRGRPPGSKNKYPTLSGLKDQASAAVKIDVPLRDPTPTPRDKFKCKWKKCSTVLHNMDTLRKHIGRIHRPSSTDVANEGYTCWWKKCKYLKQDEQGDWITTKAFDQWEDWLKHIEVDHMTPIMFRWGDGPSLISVDPVQITHDRSTYLSNSSDQIVTPHVSDVHNHNEYHPRDVLNLTEMPMPDSDAPPQTESEKAERFALAAYLRAHGMGKRSREASKEVLRSVQKRKAMIGPGMDRGGCTLINEDMRQLFVQNPGIRRVVGLNE